MAQDRSRGKVGAMQDVELVWAGHAETVGRTCSKCATDLPLCDHAEERTNPAIYFHCEGLSLYPVLPHGIPERATF